MQVEIVVMVAVMMVMVVIGGGWGFQLGKVHSTAPVAKSALQGSTTTASHEISTSSPTIYCTGHELPSAPCIPMENS